MINNRSEIGYQLDHVMSAYFPEIRKSVKIPNIMSLFKFNYQLDELVKIYLHIKSKFHPPKAVQRLDWARISSRIRIHLQQVNYLLFLLHYLNCKRWWKQTIDTNENHDTVPLMSNGSTDWNYSSWVLHSNPLVAQKLTQPFTLSRLIRGIPNSAEDL